ncbi:tyrosine-type recombinase/integrase [Massilia glaciei]|uniref:DUF4102 domain-containing protein n=1 Tax=Massilia glaciei TaxID=1524097 RepID=A0A2U2HGG5_9BURK|nr:site-specific integrase [Massilia glaciei]PWF44023.1 DUF4102 domain-containing protein [Massilia glaciei]
MASEKFSFTKSALTAVVPPSSGRTYCIDTQTRGLCLDVLASGTKTFQIYRKFDGKPKRIVLGRFSPTLSDARDLPTGTDPLSLIGNSAELNVRMARKLADAVNASMDKSVDPAANARTVRQLKEQEMTLRQAFDRYFSDHVLAHEKRSAQLMKDDFARYLGTVPAGQKKTHGKERSKSAGTVDWETRKLSSISPADTRRMLLNAKDGTGARTSNRILALLRAIFNKMIDWHLYTGANPCAGIDKFKENSRERFLTGDELPRFFAAIDKIDHVDFKDFILLSLFTGARRANVLGMRWQDINFHAAILTIPTEVSKNGNPLTIPLTDAARTVLVRRMGNAPKMANDPAEKTASPYVFAANSATGYMSPPNKHWKALLADAGIEDLRLHDLRRSLGSWAAMGGTSLPIIGKMLGHKTSQATSVYAHLQTGPVALAMEAATAAMQAQGKVVDRLPPLPPSE